jgi:phosphonatase-like hydrolase
MNNIQLVVFDIAGTTVKDEGNVSIAFIDAFKEYGIEVPETEVNLVMGFRKKDAIRILLEKCNVLPEGDINELIKKIHDAFTRNMIAVYENDPSLSPLPHAAQTFQWLQQQGIKVALNTGFTKIITDTILKRLHWQQNNDINFVISSDEVAEGRPYPFMIQAIMQKLQVEYASAVVKVGDTKVDVEEGRNARCGKVVSVTTGAYTRDQLALYKPDGIIDSLAELPSLIQ